MIRSKKALALLGLFFRLSLSLWGEEPLKGIFDLRGEAGSLWVDETGTSFYGAAVLSLRNTRGSFFELEAGTLRSDLSVFNGGLSVFRFGGGTGFHGLGLPLGFRFAGTYFEHGVLRLASGKTVIESEGGRGFFFSAALPFTLAGFTITPSWTYGGGRWDQGSFYWFLGRPELAAFHLPGLSLDYRGTHVLDLRYLAADVNILNNLGEFLFDGELTGLIPAYRFILDTRALRLEGLFGWFHGSLSLDGGLTASNQHYAFFPYSFYTVDISSPLDVAYTALDLRCGRRIFRGHFTLGALRVLSGGLSGDMDYKYKTLFGGAEGRADIPLSDIRGLGAAFFLVDGALSFDRPGPVRAVLSLQKAFIIPFGLEALAGGLAGEEGGGETLRGSLLRSVLLSGWTIRFTLEW